MKIGRNERGFTLIELMVVLIIIGILAAIAIPTMSKQTDKAKVKRAVSEMKSMKTMIDTYRAEKGTCPLADNTANIPGNISTELNSNGFKWLVTGDATTGIVDPWDNAYVYSIDDADAPTKYKLVSGGPTGGIAGDADGAKDDIVVTEEANPTENTGYSDVATVLSSTALGEAAEDTTVNSK